MKHENDILHISCLLFFGREDDIQGLMDLCHL